MKTLTNKLKPLLIVTLLASNPCFAEEDDEVKLSTTIAILTSDTAVLAAQNTISICREQGAQISVTVVDRFGIIQAQIRDTLAAPISIPISFRKAKTAANFNTVTSQLGEVSKSPIANIENLLMVPGGAPISAGGILYGAIGVSGSSGEIDELCATKGAESINEELEMQ